MTTSPQQKIYNLKRALADLGITEDRDWNAGENTYTISGESDALLFFVRLPVPEQELPEELKPHAWSDYEVDRSMSKGNAEKRTISGARFEIALKDYANKVFRERADVAELEAGVADFKSMDDFRAYEAKLQEIWNLMYEENTRLRELEQDLEENYY